MNKTFAIVAVVVIIASAGLGETVSPSSSKLGYKKMLIGMTTEEVRSHLPKYLFGQGSRRPHGAVPKGVRTGFLDYTKDREHECSYDFPETGWVELDDPKGSTNDSFEGLSSDELEAKELFSFGTIPNHEGSTSTVHAYCPGLFLRFLKNRLVAIELVTSVFDDHRSDCVPQVFIAGAKRKWGFPTSDNRWDGERLTNLLKQPAGAQLLLAEWDRSPTGTVRVWALSNGATLEFHFLIEETGGMDKVDEIGRLRPITGIKPDF